MDIQLYMVSVQFHRKLYGWYIYAISARDALEGSMQGASALCFSKRYGGIPLLFQTLHVLLASAFFAGFGLALFAPLQASALRALCFEEIGLLYTPV